MPLVVKLLVVSPLVSMEQSLNNIITELRTEYEVHKAKNNFFRDFPSQDLITKISPDLVVVRDHLGIDGELDRSIIRKMFGWTKCDELLSSHLEFIYHLAQKLHSRSYKDELSSLNVANYLVSIHPDNFKVLCLKHYISYRGGYTSCHVESEPTSNRIDLLEKIIRIGGEIGEDTYIYQRDLDCFKGPARDISHALSLAATSNAKRLLEKYPGTRMNTGTFALEEDRYSIQILAKEWKEVPEDEIITVPGEDNKEFAIRVKFTTGRWEKL